MENLEKQTIVVERVYKKKRFIVFVIFMIFVWSSLWLLFYLKADEITKDPCRICAEQFDENVLCSVSREGAIPVTRTYHTNGSITDNSEEIREMIIREIGKRKPISNLSNINFSIFDK